MIPYLILGGAGMLAALSLGSKRRKRRAHDPRTAETRRLRAVDSRYAITKRMARVNPKSRTGTTADGTRWSVKRNRETGEWMVAGYVKGRQRPMFTTWHKTRGEAVQQLNRLLSKTLSNPSLERSRRIKQALAETEHLLAKEMKYSADLRKPKYLAFLRGHIAKLKGMMLQSNPKGLIGVDFEGIRWSVKRNADTREWMVVAYVNGKRNEDKTYYTDDYEDAVNTFRHLMDTREGRVTNPRRNPTVGGGGFSWKMYTPAGTITARWGKNGIWSLRVGGKLVAAGTDYRPAPSHPPGGREAGLDLVSLALAALPGSGSGIAGDEDSLSAWTPEGIKLLDKPGVHEVISIMESEEQDNPKRRKATKTKRGKKAPKHFVRTTTHTVKTVQQNPGKRRKYRVFIGNSRHSEYVDVKASSAAEAFKEARRVDWLAAMPQNRDRLTIFS